MKVFNLTGQVIVFKNQKIMPFGSIDVDMEFIPNRDRLLEQKGVLAFGALPKNWKRPAPVVAGLGKHKGSPPLMAIPDPKENPVERHREQFKDQVPKAPKTPGSPNPTDPAPAEDKKSKK